MRRGRKQRNHGSLIQILGCAVLLGCSSPPVDRDAEYRRLAASLQQGALPAVDAELVDVLRSFRASEHPQETWRFRLLEADLRVRQGRAPDALKILDSFPFDDPQFQPLLATAASLRGSTLLRLGKPADAGEWIERAYVEAMSAGSSALLPQIESLRGQRLIVLRRLDEARTQLYTALEAAEGAGDVYYQAAVLTNLGLVAIQQNRWDEALQLLSRALTAAEAARARLIESAALNNLVICFYRLGEYERALEFSARASRIQEEQGALDFLRDSLGESGNASWKLSDIPGAIAKYERALALSRQLNQPAKASLWAANLANALVQMQRWDEAERLNRESMELRQTIGQPTLYNAFFGGLIAAGKGQLAVAEQQFTSVVRGADPDASIRWEAEHQLAKVFGKQGMHAEAEQHFRNAVDLIGARTRRSQSEFQMTFFSSMIGVYQDYVDFLVDRGDPHAALLASDSSRSRVLLEKMSVSGGRLATNRSVADLRNLAARTGSILLSYWLGPRRTYVWVVSPSRVDFVELSDTARISKLVDTHRVQIENLKDPVRMDGSAGEELYRLLVEPAEPYIPKGSRVVVVPDGVLHRINLETLVVPGSPPHYWIEDVTIQVAPSLGVLDLTRRAVKAHSALLIGDPRLPPESDLPGLPYLAREIEAIERRLDTWERTVIRGQEARPDSYLSAEPEKYGVIHFAAHATANPESPLDSAVALSPNQDSAESYKLYARQVLATPLNANLVVVSACRSAGSRNLSGEGLVGFCWAFMQAGAGRVIAGLWDVSDQSTAELMDQFYSKIAGGSTPHQALRDAKLQFLRSNLNLRKPYYWAPFQVYARSILIDRNQGARAQADF